MLKYKLRSFIIKFRFLVKTINFFYKVKYKHKYDTIISQRKNLSIFDYKDLIKDIPYPAEELVIDNNLYGLAYWLKKYAGLPTNKSTNCYIEHGLFFGSLVRPEEWQWFTPNIITYGDTRKRHIEARKINKNVILIGPFIHYADKYISDEDFLNLKKKLGKVLLVFPSHSIKQVSSFYDGDEFINFIEYIKKDYDTVLISLYWLDALRPEIVSMYENMGYRIVTSGHRYDYNFLSRQRTIIELADYTISNSVGSHLGYCIYLNKPHTVFNQQISFEGKTMKEYNIYKNVRNNDELVTELKEKQELIDYFSKYSICISQKQRDIVDKYWGTSYIKTRDQLRNVLS